MSADASPNASATRGKKAGGLTSGPIARTLFVFALPVLGANVLQSLNGSVNAVYVGRLLGADALAATANANLVLFLLLGAVFGMGMAATIMVGQAMGAGDAGQARKVVGTAASFFVAVSLLLGLGGLVLAPAILKRLGTPPEALPFALPYLRTLFLALPVMNLLALVMTVLRGAGDSRTPFAFMALAVGLDIAVNPLFIMGLGPWPGLGIAGSALATLVGQAAALLAILVLIYRRKHALRLAGRDLRLLRPDPALLKALVAKGVPMGLQMIVISASALILMGLVNAYGARTAAAYGVAAQLWTYAQMPALAIGAAVTAMAAQNIGAGRWDRIHRITAAGVGFNLLLTGALVVVLYLFEAPLLGLFLGGDAGARALAERINATVAWSFVLFGVTVVLFGTVRAAGAVAPPLVILVITLFGVRSLFAWGLQGAMGADAIWWSFPAGSVASVVLALGYYRWGRWRETPQRAAARPAAGEPPDTGLGMPRQRARLRDE